MSFRAPESLSGRIAKYLAGCIIQGELSPGERLQESRVVNKLSVSRGSVREALLILEQGHLIRILPHRGAVVTELTAENVTQLYDFYTNLLIMLSLQVAEVWQDDALEPVLAEWEIMRDENQNKDRSKFVAAGFRFLDASCDIAGNAYLTEVIRNLYPTLHRTYALAARHRLNDVSNAFRFFAEVIQVVARRDRDAIPIVIKAYGTHQRDAVLAALAEETSACA